MKRRPGLTRQSLFGAVVAAYVAPLILFWFDLIWRFQTGADARICPVDASYWCTIAEGTGAFLFTFLWALYGLPFAFLLTLPCALILGRLAPALERRLQQNNLRSVQYILGAGTGLVAAMILELATAGGEVSLTTVFAGFLAGLVGVWGFRRARYAHSAHANRP